MGSFPIWRIEYGELRDEHFISITSDGQWLKPAICHGCWWCEPWRRFSVCHCKHFLHDLTLQCLIFWTLVCFVAQGSLADQFVYARIHFTSPRLCSAVSAVRPSQVG